MLDLELRALLQQVLIGILVEPKQRRTTRCPQADGLGAFKELSRRTKGGKNRQKTWAKLTRLHERIADVRKGVTHKLTTDLVRDFRWIGMPINLLR